MGCLITVMKIYFNVCLLPFQNSSTNLRNSENDNSSLQIHLSFPSLIQGCLGSCRLVPAQDIHFFYTRSHLSALQNCALISQPIFSLLPHLKKALHNLVIYLCSALKNNLFLKSFCSKFPHIFVAIESLNF